MASDLDLQRDHKYLIEQVMHRLSKEGVLIFSTNRRSFKLDESLSQSFQVFAQGKKSLSRDFSRQRAPHQCWDIRHQKQN